MNNNFHHIFTTNYHFVIKILSYTSEVRESWVECSALATRVFFLTGYFCDKMLWISSRWVFDYESYLILGCDGHGGFSSFVLQASQLPQGGPEVWGHEAVEDEVGCTVDQGHHVHHLPHWVVAVQEELLAQDSWQNAENALKLKNIGSKWKKILKCVQNHNIFVLLHIYIYVDTLLPCLMLKPVFNLDYSIHFL